MMKLTEQIDTLLEGKIRFKRIRPGLYRTKVTIDFDGEPHEVEATVGQQADRPDGRKSMWYFTYDTPSGRTEPAHDLFHTKREAVSGLQSIVDHGLKRMYGGWVYAG